MFRIGEFSKLAKTTIKTLRFYEEAGLLKPAKVDDLTGYRYYTAEQLYPLGEISALRQAGLSIDEIHRYLNGEDKNEILIARGLALKAEQKKIEGNLLRLNALIKAEKENSTMNYNAVIKKLPEFTVYSREGILSDFSEIDGFVKETKAKFKAKYPNVKEAEPYYCFVTYLDPEFKLKNMNIEFCVAVTNQFEDFDDIKCRTVRSDNTVCVYHKGSLKTINEAYAFAINWIKVNGYEIADNLREHYISGDWNEKDQTKRITEIQIPVTDYKNEIKDKWGHTKEYSESKDKAKNTTYKDDINKIRQAKKIFDKFAAISNSSPDSKEAVELVKQWQKYISDYYYDCSIKMLSCLADMYIADERFKNNLDSHGEGTAVFMNKAIKNYCKINAENDTK